MNKTKLPSFYIIGLTVRTSNVNNQAACDIPQLWRRFMQDNLVTEIPNKVSDEVLCMYTDYEGDHTMPYTTLLGCKVINLDEVPDGMVGKFIPACEYVKFTATGDISKDLVINKWYEIWNTELPRTFTHDFEVYGEKAIDPTDSTVEIYIAVD
ncbi:GyrI-like domain-containing protein [Myroides pelagicus]|uniref:AraC family transcriptional regulator n=1 Tax=Myroides pelagicus TaxID=270914 RepID=A0A7K1GLW2_9FLAO|nr:GyrI-like domain-containing protein [Myroides pelagicus]MEC4113163.1 GyrI-like domain-containing protein [Myroides pelagicus]MTH29788.1 AraC family transcriptional regulator [Myroides pelagicus]